MLLDYQTVIMRHLVVKVKADLLASHAGARRLIISSNYCLQLSDFMALCVWTRSRFYQSIGYFEQPEPNVCV